MIQNERVLLVKDLCARSPYGVKFRYKYIDNFFHESYGTSKLEGVLPPYHIVHSTLTGDEHLKIEEDEIKPYLFPLSSMTEKQELMLSLIVCRLEDSDQWRDGDMVYVDDRYQLGDLLDFYHKNHLDYMGLIDKGLAIDATNLNIY